jgi:hypothetical protein
VLMPSLNKNIWSLWKLILLLSLVFTPQHQLTMYHWDTWLKYNQDHKMRTRNRKDVSLVTKCIF